MGELDGKVAVVTGGSRGIGRATVERLAAEGATVAICARSQEPLDQAARELSERHGAQVLAVTADILNRRSVETFIERVGAAYGRIDILVNNAGEAEQNRNEKVAKPVAAVDTVGADLPPSRFAEMDESEFQKAFDRKFFGMLRVTRAAMPLLRRSDAASIVTVTSIKGQQAPPRIATSGIAWAAAMNWSKALSQELGPENIRVNVVSVGGIVTPNLLTAYDRWGEGQPLEDYFAPRTRNLALKRLGTAAEVADAIYFLASPHAAYITGQCLALDGGGVRML